MATTQTARAARRMSGIGGAAAAVVLVGSALVPAQAAGGSYVALGDSYSSGVGTRVYLDDGTSCQRSIDAHPSLIAAARGNALNLRACSGATTADVTTTQLDARSASTAYVTISIDGNDAGFANVLTECALPGRASDCDGKIDAAQTFISATLPGRLSNLYSGNRAKAPSAERWWRSATRASSRARTATLRPSSHLPRRAGSTPRPTS